MINLKRIEALLYIRGDQGLSPKDLKDIIEVSTSDARKALKDFLKTYNAKEEALLVVEFNDVFKIATRAEYKDDISKMVTIIKKQKLSGS
ncbi:MAG: SMC-Scp complex subunit ScpB, partial [Mycoplasmataceae bacterium]|nr:SMC-Scp complex subunit ScpB [Mycoplasmataceae bacterium]